MNIVVLGGGTVGTSLCKSLGGGRHNVCLIDRSPEVLELASEQLDVQTVKGSACDAVTLFQAGVQSCDLCLAVTSKDEVNLVGASLAKKMGAERAVARVFNPSYLDSSTFDYRRHFGVDRLLSLERLTALELARSVRMRGMFVLENLVRGGVEVQEVRVETDAPACGVPLKDLRLGSGVLAGVIVTDGVARIPNGEDAAKAGDQVTLIGTGDNLETAARRFRKHAPPKLLVVIGGGGETGYNLARILARGRFSVVLMEGDRDRAEELATKLDGVTVLHADVTRRSEMEEARVGKAGVFVAATGRDEDNIVCGVEARELGAGRIMSVVRRADYANVLGKLGIDVAVSPRDVMSRQVDGMVQTGAVLARFDVAGRQAAVYEVEVRDGCDLLGVPLKDVGFRGALIAAIDREDFVRVPGANDALKAGDVAVVLAQADAADAVLNRFVGG